MPRKKRSSKEKQTPALPLDEASKQYKVIHPLADALKMSISEEFAILLRNNDISLAFPLEFRTKTWQSVEAKLQTLGLKHLREMQDLVGLRVVLQFRRDIERVAQIIDANFLVVRSYDTAKQLSEDQFGYASVHYVVKLKAEWQAVPRFSGLGDLSAEIQVRTTAQHIWAVASHDLQYKVEDSVPKGLRRSIHRISALLETVDLEFERLLIERDTYRSALPQKQLQADDLLNVDLLESLLSKLLPSANKDSIEEEEYSDLLQELFSAGVRTAAELESLFTRGAEQIATEEQKMVEDQQLELARKGILSGLAFERVSAGVFYTHVGLTRVALNKVLDVPYPQMDDDFADDPDLSDDVIAT